MIGVLDLRPVVLVTGVLMAALGAAMLVPAGFDLIESNPDWRVFASASAVTLFAGVALFFATRGRTGGLSTRQAMLMTVAVWTALALFGALPYLWSGVVPTFADAFFESMSGLTTTGATVISGLDEAPPGILMWRAIQQWLGGLGIIVMAVSVLPMLQIGGMQIFRAEAFDTPEKILPRARQMSGAMTRIFLGLTGLCALLYWLAGMSVFDAIAHSMTTVATGGYSTKDGSIGHFDSVAIDTIAILFMIVGSLPFLLFVAMLNGQPISVMWRDAQVRLFLVILSVATGIAWAMAVVGGHAGPGEPCGTRPSASPRSSRGPATRTTITACGVGTRRHSSSPSCSSAAAPARPRAGSRSSAFRCCSRSCVSTSRPRSTHTHSS